MSTRAFIFYTKPKARGRQRGTKEQSLRLEGEVANIMNQGGMCARGDYHDRMYSCKRTLMPLSLLSTTATPLYSRKRN